MIYRFIFGVPLGLMYSVLYLNLLGIIIAFVLGLGFGELMEFIFTKEKENGNGK